MSDLTLREQLAIAALGQLELGTGIRPSDGKPLPLPEVIADCAVQYADAVIARLEATDGR